MSRPFEPKDVVENYRRLGIKAMTGLFNLDSSSGTYEPYTDCGGEKRVCALSTFLAGRERIRDVEHDILDLFPQWGSDQFWSFIGGFDGTTFERGLSMIGKGYDREAYDLGKECRTTLVDEGLL